MICCSATWPAGVRRLAQSYMTNPIQVFIGSLDLAAVHSVTQKIELVEEEDKDALVCVLFSARLQEKRMLQVPSRHC